MTTTISRRSPEGAGRKAEWSATEAIKSLILEEELRPGDPLPTETALCERLGVSRSSVREAIRTLTSLDIVEVRHGRGTFVGGLSLDPLINGLTFRAKADAHEDLRTLREVLDVRIALDLSVAETLVSEYSGAPNAELDRLVRTMTEKAQAGELFLEEDRAFHALLLSSVDNTLISELVTAFWTIHTEVQPYLGVAPGDDIIETARAHGTMLDAVRAGDAEAYRAAVHAHYAPLRRAVDRARGHQETP